MSWIRAILKSNVQGLMDIFNGGQVLIAAWPDNDPVVEVACFGNATGQAMLVFSAVTQFTRQPRPTDCEACGKAWDAMVEARLALDPTNRDTVCA